MWKETGEIRNIFLKESLEFWPFRHSAFQDIVRKILFCEVAKRKGHIKMILRKKHFLPTSLQQIQNEGMNTSLNENSMYKG